MKWTSVQDLEASRDRLLAAPFAMSGTASANAAAAYDERIEELTADKPISK